MEGVLMTLSPNTEFIQEKIKTDPEEFLKFHAHITKNHPNYQPFYFPLVKNGKDPLPGNSWKKNRKTFSQAYNLMKEGYNIGIAATDKDRLCIVDIDNLGAVGETKPTLTVKSRKQIGRHCFYFTDDPVQIDGTIYNYSAKQNIATSKSGEVRAVGQYVVVCGSFVPCSKEEIARMPEKDRGHAGKYRLHLKSDVSNITFDELPEVFKQVIEEKREGALTAQLKPKIKQSLFDPDKRKSALWGLDIHDVTGKLNSPGKRFEMFPELHESETGKNASISGDLLHCWRHNVSQNALTFLGAASGVCTCPQAGFPHGEGVSDFDIKDPYTQFTVWKYAKDKQYIPKDDPMPSQAMIYIALSSRICKKKDIMEGWKLPVDAYNKVLEECEKQGIETGRTKLTVNKDTPEPENTTSHTNLADLNNNSGVFYNSIADLFIEKYHAKTLEGGDLRIYEDGIYPEIKNKYIINNLVMKTAVENGVDLTPNRITTAIEMIKVKTPYIQPEENLNKIAVSNGVLDVITWEFTPFSPDIVFLNKLPVEYNPDAPKPEMFLESLDRTFKGVEYQISTLQETFGYCFYRKYPIAAIFFFLGDGKNGKTIIIRILSSLLGDENTSGLTISDIAQPKNEHILMDLRGKYANVCGDVGKKKIDDTAFLKMITGRDKIRARGLYKDSVTFINHAKAIFALNQLPEIEDFSDGFKRRIKIIDFPNKFDGDSEIAELDEAIIKAGELPGILNWALEGLKRLIENNKFSNEKTVAEVGIEYDMKSNPVSHFVRACIDENLENVEETSKVLEHYMEYRQKYGLPTLSKKEFKRKFIKACEDIGITTCEKRKRPSMGDNKDRYYGFEGIKVNVGDLKKCLKEPKKMPLEPSDKQASFEPEFMETEMDRMLYTDLTTFMQREYDKSEDTHEAAIRFCARAGGGYKIFYGLDFIESEIKKRINFDTNLQN